MQAEGRWRAHRPRFPTIRTERSAARQQRPSPRCTRLRAQKRGLRLPRVRELVLGRSARIAHMSREVLSKDAKKRVMEAWQRASQH